MQPLLISTSVSSARESAASPRATSWASMFTSLMSLTMTATRRPSRFSSTWLRREVFPAPRKPLSTVTGKRVVIVFVHQRSIGALSGSAWRARNKA